MSAQVVHASFHTWMKYLIPGKWSCCRLSSASTPEDRNWSITAKTRPPKPGLSSTSAPSAAAAAAELRRTRSTWAAASDPHAGGGRFLHLLPSRFRGRKQLLKRSQPSNGWRNVHSFLNQDCQISDISNQTEAVDQSDYHRINERTFTIISIFTFTWLSEPVKTCSSSFWSKTTLVLHSRHSTRQHTSNATLHQHMEQDVFHWDPLNMTPLNSLVWGLQ